MRWRFYFRANPDMRKYFCLVWRMSAGFPFLSVSANMVTRQTAIVIRSSESAFPLAFVAFPCHLPMRHLQKKGRPPIL